MLVYGEVIVSSSSCTQHETQRSVECTTNSGMLFIAAEPKHDIWQITISLYPWLCDIIGHFIGQSVPEWSVTYHRGVA